MADDRFWGFRALQIMLEVNVKDTAYIYHPQLILNFAYMKNPNNYSVQSDKRFSFFAI